jgi:secreted trypsin-like serine protease
VPVIINGRHVREGAWPWHAAIYLRRTSDSIDFRCGSTIINKRTLITIATCLVTYNPKVQKRIEITANQLIVGVGETVLFDASGARQNHRVERVKFHENFLKDGRMKDGLKDDFNVAILLLNEDIMYSLHVRPICLPESDEYDYDDRIGKVVGW